ncbi:MAG: CotH kinase family protein [Clostridia bacterium]|nr:CotH kinase family protein [Clostridia bacterium]
MNKENLLKISLILTAFLVIAVGLTLFFVIHFKNSSNASNKQEDAISSDIIENLEVEKDITLTLNSNISKGLNFEVDGELYDTLENQNIKNLETVNIIPKLGYKFLYYEIDGNQITNNIINLKDIKESSSIICYADYATDELPIININVDGEINSKDKEDYTQMTFNLLNSTDELSNISGGIRLRGNSTSGYDKKPYRIKFDKKQSLFGLPKAKSWVLLAEYLDPSNLHNYAALNLGNELDNLSFTPHPQKVNLYLNDEYVGLYTLCEQVQENSGRMNIEMNEITEDMADLKDFNFFISMDASVTGDPTSILDKTYFYLEEYDKYIELKYPEKEDFCSEEQFQSFFGQLKIYVKDIFDTFYDKNVESIKSKTNINSLIDFLIVDQIMGESDHVYKSFNMFYTTTSKNISENYKLNFGPIWDYDWCLYTPWTGCPNESYVVSNEISYSNIFFQAIQNCEELFTLYKQRYQNVGSDAISTVITKINEIQNEIITSLELNQDKWYNEIDEDLTTKNLDFLNNWLTNRKTLLDSLLNEH